MFSQKKTWFENHHQLFMYKINANKTNIHPNALSVQVKLNTTHIKHSIMQNNVLTPAILYINIMHNNTEISHQFQNNLEERLSDTPKENLSINYEWTSLRKDITKVCEETLGYQTKHHQHWCDDNDTTIKDLIDKRRAAFMDCQNHQNCHTHTKHQRLHADVQGKIITSRTNGGEQRPQKYRSSPTTTRRLISQPPEPSKKWRGVCLI